MLEPALRMMRCPKCQKTLHLAQTTMMTEEVIEGNIICDKGHRWQVRDGIASMFHPGSPTQHIVDRTQFYRDLLGIDMDKEKERLAAYVPIEGPLRVLDTNLGSGSTYAALSRQFEREMGRFNLHGIDSSFELLQAARAMSREKGFNLTAVHGNVFNLPYQSDSFHLVLAIGSINQLADKAAALREMWRVTTPEGHVLIVDEGLSPQMRKSDAGNEILKKRPSFGARPPIPDVPDKARDLEITYVMKDAFYQLVFRK